MCVLVKGSVAVYKKNVTKFRHVFHVIAAKEYNLPRPWGVGVSPVRPHTVVFAAACFFPLLPALYGCRVTARESTESETYVKWMRECEASAILVT